MTAQPRSGVDIHAKTVLKLSILPMFGIEKYFCFSVRKVRLDKEAIKIASAMT